MAEVAVVNSEGAEVGKVELSPEVFEVQPHVSLMHKAVVAHLANRRSGTADTLTRAEVRGGGRKPWRQKGTGHARQGSIRAPHWAGGGVAFGPHPRDYSLDMPKKMRRLALKSALSVKLAEGQIKVIDDLKMEAISTKRLVEILGKIGVEDKAMIVLAGPDEVVRKSARNVPWVALRVAPSISTYDLLNADTVVFVKDALAKIEEAHAK
ncbi:MAG TPA: 50S ribosomal protein L4 [Armatimonadota bacterium]|nr:50S ribosomal protein L4 [Armatimonadota bacterium]